MRIGIYSDIHGNSDALNVVIKALKKDNIDFAVCLGDVVGYGPEPNECIERVMNHSKWVLTGNHDYAVCGLTPTENFTTLAAMVIHWTQRQLTESSKQILMDLPLNRTEYNALWVHATPGDPPGWHYLTTLAEAKYHFDLMQESLCFVGHSHIPGIFISGKDGNIVFEKTDRIRFEEGNKYIVNVGSVGQPRDGDPRACYGIWDIDEHRFKLQRIAYPIERVQEKMRKQNLPEYLIQRLKKGR